MKIEKKTWEEFCGHQFLWWINHLLHVAGWAIVVEKEDGRITDVYPARVDCRGFDRQAEAEGFAGLTEYFSNNAKDLLEDIKSE